MADAKADVVIKINVNDADAKRKLTSLGAELKTLGKAGQDSKLDNIGKDLDNVGKNAAKAEKELSKTGSSTSKFKKTFEGLESGLKRVGNAFGSLMKFVKLAGMEFGAMTAALGALKLGLVAAELVAKGFQATMRGLGAAAGVAVGGLATVLGAVRELQNAKLAPFFGLSKQATTGPIGGQARMAGILGDSSFGMFKDATLVSSAQAEMRQGGKLNASYRQMMKTLGDFAISEADPDKALSGLIAGFSEAAKKGKFTQQSFQQIASAAPDVAKGFEEIYGGQKHFQTALAAGHVTADKFFTELKDGRINALEPFKGSLDRVNNTLMGRFKGALKVVKEQLTEMGTPLVSLFKAPIGTIQKDLQVFLMKVTPTIQSTFAQLVPGLGAAGEGVLGKLLNKLAASINTNMPKLVGFGERFMDLWTKVKGFFGGLGDTLRRVTKSFDTLWNDIIKPVAREIGTTIGYAFTKFSETVKDNEPYFKSFSERIHTIFEGVRRLVDGFAQLKTVLAPFADTLTKLAEALAQLLKIPGAGFLAMAGIFGATTGGGLFKSKKGQGFGSSVIGSLLGFQGASFAGGAYGGPTGNARSGTSMRAKYYGTLGRYETAKSNFLAGTSAGMTPFASARSVAGNWWLGTGIGKSAAADSLINYPVMQYGISRESGAGRIRALRDAGKEFFKGGVKPFAQAVGPTVGSIAAMAVGGYVQSHTEKTSRTGQMLGSALSMAGTGAMLGTMLGPAGTATGAIVGGIAGGIAGLASGFFTSKSAQEVKNKEVGAKAKADATAQYKTNRLFGEGGLIAQTEKTRKDLASLARYDSIVKERGKQQSQITSLIDKLPASVQDAMGLGYTVVGGGEGATVMRKSIFGDYSKQDQSRMLGQLMDSGKVTGDQRNLIQSYLNNTNIKDTLDTLSNGNIKEYTKSLQAEYDKNYIGVSRLKGNYSALSDILGMSASEVEKFGDALGKDLKDNFISMTDVIAKLGYGLDKQSEAANRATAAGRILSDTMTTISTEMDKIDANQAYNAAGDLFFNMSNPSETDLQKASGDFFGQYMTKQTQRFASGEYGDYRTFAERTKAGLSSFYDSAVQQNVDPAVLAEVARRQGQIGSQLDKGLTDVGTRLNYDPYFAIGLNSKMSSVASRINAMGLTSASDIQGAVAREVAKGSEMDKFMSAQGMSLTEENRKSLQNLLLGQMQNQGTEFANALKDVVLQVAVVDSKGLTTSLPSPTNGFKTNGVSTVVNGGVNITVQGSPDPVATAEEVKKKLDALNKSELERK